MQLLNRATGSSINNSSSSSCCCCCTCWQVLSFCGPQQLQLWAVACFRPQHNRPVIYYWELSTPCSRTLAAAHSSGCVVCMQHQHQQHQHQQHSWAEPAAGLAAQEQLDRQTDRQQHISTRQLQPAKRGRGSVGAEACRTAVARGPQLCWAAPYQVHRAHCLVYLGGGGSSVQSRSVQELPCWQQRQQQQREGWWHGTSKGSRVLLLNMGTVLHPVAALSTQQLRGMWFMLLTGKRGAEGAVLCCRTAALFPPQGQHRGHCLCCLIPSMSPSR